MSSDKNDSGRLLAQPKPGKLIFFSLCFTMRTGGPQKDFSIVSSMTPSNGGNGLQHRSASSSSLQGEKERGDRGPARRRSAADAAPKKNGDQAKRARAPRIHGVMKHPSIVPCMVKGAGNRGTPHSWTIIEHVGQKLNNLDVDLGTCGCVDHRQNFGPQSVESINTSAACTHTRASELEVGESPDY